VDGAGIVSALGPDAEGVSIGDRVVIMPGLSCGECGFCKKGQDNQCDSFEILGTKRNGTYAEKVAVPDQNVVPLPENISFETAAAFPVAYLTAWHMLAGRAQLKPKENILIVGASSGVAIAGIQIAKFIGARVFASTTNPSKIDMIKAAGADEIYNGQTGMDVVMEHVGPATWETSMKAVSKYGRIVTCGATTGPKVDLDLRMLFGRNVTLFGARMGTQRDFQEVCKTIFPGKIKPIIDKVFPLAEAKDAHLRMEEKKQVGKIILSV
jgi:NADPH2:quinone reductase